MICRCYDNKMHGVAWAQVHSISFPADRDVNFKQWTNLSFGQTLRRKLNSANVPLSY